MKLKEILLESYLSTSNIQKAGEKNLVIASGGGVYIISDKPPITKEQFTELADGTGYAILNPIGEKNWDWDSAMRQNRQFDSSQPNKPQISAREVTWEKFVTDVKWRSDRDEAMRTNRAPRELDPSGIPKYLRRWLDKFVSSDIIKGGREHLVMKVVEFDPNYEATIHYKVEEVDYYIITDVPPLVWRQFDELWNVTFRDFDRANPGWQVYVKIKPINIHPIDSDHGESPDSWLGDVKEENYHLGHDGDPEIRKTTWKRFFEMIKDRFEPSGGDFGDDD